ncbi:MAG TPA: GFA family protein [Ornithinimicrobium sp.]|uniref:GFA family protein n=1 Tax=Ornithinimicrobium sp. TaxID=1977084 RepID=UPI002B4A3FE9|nr:GFA family protein [Ornithinimicrobium sp.]HKJ10829.1 GFA family protein [Ornithinimicrobium sp.]
MEEGARSGPTATGGCACGAVRYHCAGPMRPVFNCHCERCRRITGHFMAASGCAATDLVVGEDGSLRWYEPAPGVFYGFCGTCGSTLFWRSDGVADWVSISAGTLDTPTGLTTTSAWWTDVAADYHHLDDRLESYPTEPAER